MSTTHPPINALLVRQQVNCGDHAETVTQAVEVDPDETVQQLVERLLQRDRWEYRDKSPSRSREPDGNASLVLRLAVRVKPEEA